MIKYFSRLNKNEDGQSMVEFALILPIVLMLLLGIIQFGFIFNGQITLTSAAREGARLAVVNSSDSEVKDRVEEAAVALLLNFDKEGDDVRINRTMGDGKLSVAVDGTVDVIVPFLGMVVGESFALSSESIMRIEVE